jgi:hypothetical protein
MEGHVSCSGFRAGFGIERRQSRHSSGFAGDNHRTDRPLRRSRSVGIGSTHKAVRFIPASKSGRILAATFAIVSCERFDPYRTVTG